MINYFLVFLFLFFTINASGNEIIVMVSHDTLKDYNLFLKGRNPLTITDFHGQDSRRDVVEVVLFQQALNLGHLPLKFNFIESPSYHRTLAEIEVGRAALSAESIWKSDIDPNKFFATDPTIVEGEFEAGLYTIKSNSKAISARMLKDVQELTAVSSKAWAPDWKVLSQLKLKNLVDVTKWDSMVNMVNISRVDFLLAPFQPTPDMSLTFEGITLVPIPKIKVKLEGSRVFAVSKKHPLGPKIFKALNIGIKELKKKGIIKKAYEQSGFFNVKVKNWKKIN